MSRYTLENEQIKIEVDSHGGELKSLINKKNQKEYMWCGNPEFWGRTAPVLFPFVGSLKNGKYIWKENEYTSGQHGFARDMEFAVRDRKEDSIWFELTSDEELMKRYPFTFRLCIGYQLINNKLKVLWKVENKGNEKMYFSLGGHPAFMCPITKETVQSDYYLQFDGGNYVDGLLLDQGLVGNQVKRLELVDGYFKITEDLFDEDALIIEHNQAHCVSLCMPNKKPYLTVAFDAPLFGLWSPAKKNAPFICIEPWYGRSDALDFTGELKDRVWGNSLEVNKVFESGYEVIIEA